MQSEKTYDEWLIYKVRTGETKAFGMLAERWYPKLMRHICFLVRNDEVAKDIAQDTWSIVIRKLHTLKEPVYFKMWIFRIASNKSADWIKREQKTRIVKDEIKKTESTYILENDDENNDIEKLRVAMKRLSDNEQHILNLFYTESCNIREISKILTIPTGTVKSRLFKAREHLKDIINT